MYGIKVEAGVNNCEWNLEGKCTNPKCTRNIIPKGFHRDWDSRQKCTFTILGVHLCGEFKPEAVLQR